MVAAVVSHVLEHPASDCLVTTVQPDVSLSNDHIALLCYFHEMAIFLEKWVSWYRLVLCPPPVLEEILGIS